jgi:hypothetical protein
VNSTKNRDDTLDIWKAKAFLIHLWHALCYSGYIEGYVIPDPLVARVMLLWIYGRPSHSWSTCGTRDATHASQKRGNNYEIVTTANGIYLWWQIFVSGKQFMMAMVKVMISTLPPETVPSVASLSASSYHKEIPIGNTSSGISYQLLKDTFFICMCCWNVASSVLGIFTIHHRNRYRNRNH